ncbi:MAG: cytochrome c oxidase accessory protein CcoG [Rhodospirillaceae bacterium]|nr:cytochrome c oxidase accessory protein CcoG [Rhodospirillaceae bacterium]
MNETPETPPSAPESTTSAHGAKGGMSDSKTSLYAKHVKIYPQWVRGMFRNIKWTVLGALLSLYYLIPWLRWDRGAGTPDQAVLVDMTGRRLYFFWIEIWPQEIYYLTGILIIGAIGLFMVTALAGRVWCGFTCPQTVWTDLFLFVEHLIEGDRNKRKKLDAGPLTLNKAVRKILKHSVWVLISALTGGAWIMYYVDAPTVTMDILTGQASTTVYGFFALFTGTTYLLAGWAREQLCVYMCPWPRFQGAMFDVDSLVVTYEGWRGEPRGKPKSKAPEGVDSKGDCIDCELCRHVCPTGIDIRDGLQLGCIGCGLCIDVCNQVMDRIGSPRQLIRYDSISNQVSRETGKEVGFKFLRPRILIYAAILAVVIGIMAFTMGTRKTTEINIQRDRSPLFVTLSDGSVRNGYTFKILNMVREDRSFVLGTQGVEGAIINIVGKGAGNWKAAIDVTVKPDNVGTFRVYVRAPAFGLDGRSQELNFELLDTVSGKTTLHESIFYGPGNK